MGVPVRLVVYAADEATAERACKAAYARIAELDNTLSDYKPDSELNQLCKEAGGPPTKVSDDLFIVLRHSQEVARLSDGAFDATVGPLVRLWRKARKTKQFPMDDELREAKARVGWQKVRLDDNEKTVQLLAPGMQLDFGGIAKGYAGDCALAVLKQHGVTRAMIEAGGDIVVGDPPPGKAGWAIELFDDQPPSPPFINSGGSRGRLLVNAAISTSGDTEQFVEFNGKRYSHIINPKTGLGLTDRLAVTVVGKQGIITDALSTAISVLGAEKGRALAEKFPGTTVYARRVD